MAKKSFLDRYAPPPQQPWDPKFPDFTWDKSDLRHAPLSGRDLEWVTPPPTSHLLAFYFDDARSRSKANVVMTRKNDSYLIVRFKPSGKRGVTEYYYFFNDHERGARIFEKMKAAAHPGQVVHDDLIGGRVPYDRTA